MTLSRWPTASKIRPDAITRFVLVQRPGSLPERTGADKTTLSLFIRSDQPGALLAILNEFAVRTA
jgi:prephenate dehydratase